MVKINNKSVDLYIQEGLLALLPCYREGVGGTVVFTLQDSYRDRREITWLVKKLASYYSINLVELRSQCMKLLKLKRYASLPLADGLVLLPVKMRQAAQPGETTMGYLNLLQVAKILPPAVVPSRKANSSGASLPGAGPQGAGAVGGPAKTANSPGASPQAGNARAAEHRGIYFTKRGSPGVSWKTETDAPAVSPRAGENEPVWLSRVKFKCGLQIKTLNTPETLHDRLRQGEAVLQDYHKRQKQGTIFTGLSRQELLGQLPDCNCILKDIFKDILSFKISKN